MDAPETPFIEIDKTKNINLDSEKNSLINTNIDIEDNKQIQVKEANNILSKGIICGECKENCLIKINDYTINLYGCRNGHNIKNLLIENFEKTQNIQNLRKICEKCNKYNDEFYKCVTCNLNICSNCKLDHNKEHKIIELEKLKFICNEHLESFIKYCEKCNKNLCIQCEKEHKEHKIIYFGDILPNIVNENDKLKELIDKLNDEINKIIKQLKNIINNLKMYYKISNNIINNYNNNRNYQILNNTNEFIKYNNIIIKDIKSIINNDNINIQFQNLMNIYYKIKNFNSNYIIGEIDIKENDVNKEIRIINNNNKALNDQYSDIKYEENEEIEKNCEITIDDKNIPYSFFFFL